ncbi:hypothetical protein Tco_0307625, partial [Tanacetum coccineum]
MEYLPKRRWSTLEKKRANIMIKAIDKQLKERSQNWRDLPKDIPLDSVEVLRKPHKDASVIRMASAAVKSCHGDSSEFYLITDMLQNVIAKPRFTINVNTRVVARLPVHTSKGLTTHPEE